MAQKFPLEWPVGYPRTTNRERSKFKNPTLDRTVKNIVAEIGRLIGDRWGRNNEFITISSNVPLRIDGYPRADYLRSNITDRGVAVYFKHDGNDVVMCCDKYDTIESNMHAIYKSIEALRSIDRWGVSDFMKRSFTGFKALPEQNDVTPWYKVLCFKNAPSDFKTVRDQYLQLVKLSHPDAGGSTQKTQELNEAYQQAKNYYEL
jgi:hypothetical protein